MKPLSNSPHQMLENLRTSLRYNQHSKVSRAQLFKKMEEFDREHKIIGYDDRWIERLEHGFSQNPKSDRILLYLKACRAFDPNCLTIPRAQEIWAAFFKNSEL